VDAGRSARVQGQMADYLFVPQGVLDKWSEQGKVSVDGHVLTLLGEGRSFQLTSAVRFLKMEAGEDVARLLAKVKTTDALKQMGAEHYMESVILGESAYQVQQGFLADANAIRAVAAAAPKPAQPPPPPPDAFESAPPPPPATPAATQAKAKTTDEENDLLAQFLLENMQ
jgi:hypothetical protein